MGVDTSTEMHLPSLRADSPDPKPFDWQTILTNETGITTVTGF